ERASRPAPRPGRSRAPHGATPGLRHPQMHDFTPTNSGEEPKKVSAAGFGADFVGFDLRAVSKEVPEKRI
ncbi:MAG: hypothetical protein ACM3ZE_22770, partial [Myxococcales bacterium]